MLPLIALAACAAAPPPTYDLVIRGGRVLDGAGNPAFTADLGIRRGRIADIGRSLAPGARELAADGCIVAPGLVDVHTHGEGVLKLPSAENFIRQGVTTIIVGNCGSSAPDIGRFFRTLERQRCALNVASLVGHGTVREQAMGGSFNRPPSGPELTAMEKLVDRAMRAGALGLSTGLIYQPGSFAETDEIVALARVVSRFDGIYTSHMRSEGDAILEALREVFRIAEEGRVRCQISHIKLSGNNNWGRAAEALTDIEHARSRGLDITQDQYVYTASSTGISQLVPSWAREGGVEAFRQRLASPEERERMTSDMTGVLARRAKSSYDWVTIASCPSNAALNGLTIPQAARARSRSADLDAQIKLILDLHSEGGAAGVFHGISEEDLQVFLRHPNTMLGSDSGVREFGKDVPHPRGYGNHVRVLGRYVRELGVLTLPDAVRKMTSLPSSVFRLVGRGLLREGMWADVVVFDPAAVADPATFERPHQYALGVRHVIVNGEPVISEGRATGAMPGKALRAAGRRGAPPP